jgi:alpha-1,3-rhamnosyl/mannosyltransferase
VRIAIDARAASEDRGGRGRLTRELLAALAHADGHGHEITLLARSRWDGLPPGGALRWRLDALPDPLWHARAALTASRSCDVLLSTNSYLTAGLARVPTVAFVMDLVAYRPELAPQRRARRIELATLPLAVRRARTLLCISRATEADLVARFPAARGRTAVVLLAAHERFGPGDPAADAPVLARHGLDRGYVLGVGTLEPRKNLPRLVEAFAGLPDAVRAGRRLVLVGATGWDVEPTLRAIDAHGALVTALGHVPEGDLPALYRGAGLFAYPSLYEGFGLPVLEALRCGTAVLTSATSSLPEVAGDAAVYVEPTDVGSIRAGLERALGDGALRAGLAARGPERARGLTWERTAREVVAVLEAAAA